MVSLTLPKHLKQSYIVCSTGRSGSTLLCKTLEKLGCCGKPLEYFHHNTVERLQLNDNPDNFISYCNSILEEGLTDNGTFGIKMHWWQMSDFLKMARKSLELSGKKDVEILNYIFPNLQFIYIRRKNLTKQAVSTVIALQTKQWSKPKENEQTRKTSDLTKQLKFQPLKIYHWEKKFADQNRRWQQFLRENNLEFRELVYEDFVDNFVPEIEKIISYLGVDKNSLNHEIEPPLQKQSSTINEQFLQRYKLIPKWATKIGYELQRKL